MSQNKTIEERILALEKRYNERIGSSILPGTMLERTLHPKEGGGVIWSLAIGGMQRPKIFFCGSTIEEVLALAEKNLDSHFDEGFKRYFGLADLEEDFEGEDFETKSPSWLVTR